MFDCKNFDNNHFWGLYIFMSNTANNWNQNLLSEDFEFTIFNCICNVLYVLGCDKLCCCQFKQRVSGVWNRQ